MRILMSVLLTVGLLFQTVDIILPASRKEHIRDRFLAVSSVLRSYATFDVAKVALAGFSDYLDVCFGKKIFGIRSLMLISIIHFFVFIALFLPLLYVFIDDDRRISYGWVWPPSKSDFEESRMEAKRLAPSFVYPDYDSAVVTLRHLLPIAGTTWLIASLLTSCLLSYISLWITRSLLRRALGSANMISLFMFVWLDLSVALLLVFLFAIAIIELSSTAIEIIVAIYIFTGRAIRRLTRTLLCFI